MKRATAGTLAPLVLVALVTLGVAGAFAARWWRTPAPVPDHAAPPSATFPFKFAGNGTLSQRIRPQYDRLTGVDLVISAESEHLPGDILLRVESWPSRQVVRTASLPASAAPAGDPWTFRPGQPSERWLTFGFPPIPDSAGRDFLVVLSYPAGVDQPGRRLATLAHLPSIYPWGQMEAGASPLDGNLLFRVAVAGTRGDAVLVAAGNLARTQPFVPGTLIVPATLAALCGALAMSFTWRLVRPGEQYAEESDIGTADARR